MLKKESRMIRNLFFLLSILFLYFTYTKNNQNLKIKQANNINETTQSPVSNNEPALKTELSELKEGSFRKEIVVAVIDTGVDFNNPKIKNNLVKIKNQYGLDFSKSQNPMDFHGHGTHVAGIIKQVFPEVKILNLKYYDAMASGAENLDSSIKALKYAIDKNVAIINYSGGGPEASVEELRLLRLAEKKGILIVSAAGNERSNIDNPENHYYPASYKMKNTISVCGHDEEYNLVPSSNYGENSVDICASGLSVISLGLYNGISRMTGTSQATAFVSGLAAKLLSKNKKLSPNEIKNIIIENGDNIENLKFKNKTGIALNIEKTLKRFQQQSRKISNNN